MLRHSVLFLVAALLLPLPAIVAAPAPSANDNFALRIPVTLGSPVQLDNRGDTKEPGELTCGRLEVATVWYSLTVATRTRVEVRVSPGTDDVDPVVGVYTGSRVDALTRLVCRDRQAAGGVEQAYFWAEPGVSYSIQVGAWLAEHLVVGPSGPGAMTLLVRAAPTQEAGVFAYSAGITSSRLDIAGGKTLDVETTDALGRPTPGAITFYDSHDLYLGNVAWCGGTTLVVPPFAARAEIAGGQPLLCLNPAGLGGFWRAIHK